MEYYQTFSSCSDGGNEGERSCCYGSFQGPKTSQTCPPINVAEFWGQPSSSSEDDISSSSSDDDELSTSEDDNSSGGDSPSSSSEGDDNWYYYNGYYYYEYGYGSSEDDDISSSKDDGDEASGDGGGASISGDSPSESSGDDEMQFICGQECPRVKPDTFPKNPQQKSRFDKAISSSSVAACFFGISTTTILAILLFLP